MWLLFLIPACAAAVLSCIRLVRMAATADALADQEGPRPPEAVGIGLYETAYLAGGPDRVVELALVLMASRGRLHLAHTGWTTVVDPKGRSRLERAVIATVGPDGQCRTDDLRRAMAAHPTVLEIGGRLALAGLATPAPVQQSTVLVIRQVRQALLLSLVLMAGAVAVGGLSDGDALAPLAWFSLPLVLTAGTLLMARVDVYPYTRWASPIGQEVLREVRPPRQHGLGDDDERELLTAVAMIGPAAVPDPRLRAALRHRH
ncbi:TIGR04222 domain-containing membrane protein [Streptomyces sp. CB01881]|uniref:TIGR04222 domain-containing membrane protein n=1 Tax=Streptomyces sp. CB01881 TaxID=2078691 RepID=UPI000CDC9982|nr:TIGR04222 domain-containing membrane protein [Streptomyces sp. CB01881]AUY49472.1 TIGR04222 domain-containing membrane protein [Streptomyces sp. CB01881]TYC72856.1 TIGR04222 domain-containing membrane protein [Streptomyces sp. CB01881]